MSSTMASGMVNEVPSAAMSGVVQTTPIALRIITKFGSEASKI